MYKEGEGIGILRATAMADGRSGWWGELVILCLVTAVSFFRNSNSTERYLFQCVFPA